MTKRLFAVVFCVTTLAVFLTACAPKNPHHLPVDHIVILMQENRSADHYLGHLNALQPDYEASRVRSPRVLQVSISRSGI